MARISGIGGIVTAIVMTLVGVLVGYNVYTTLAAQLANVSGLWSVASTLLGIIVPVVFILMVVALLR